MFTLNIECSKEFDELHITFSDGTVVKTNDKSKKHPRRKTNDDQTKIKSNKTEVHDKNDTDSNIHQSGGFLDTDADFSSVQKDVVKPPVIEDRERPVKVASELQNLDI